MKEKLDYRIELTITDIILYIKYSLENELPKMFKYTYSRYELSKLLLTQGKDNFMQYQFKYIVDKMKDLKIKELFMNQRQNIRKDILKLLNAE